MKELIVHDDVAWRPNPEYKRSSKYPKGRSQIYSRIINIRQTARAIQASDESRRADRTSHPCTRKQGPAFEPSEEKR